MVSIFHFFTIIIIYLFVKWWQVLGFIRAIREDRVPALTTSYSKCTNSGSKILFYLYGDEIFSPQSVTLFLLIFLYLKEGIMNGKIKNRKKEKQRQSIAISNMPKFDEMKFIFWGKDEKILNMKIFSVHSGLLLSPLCVLCMCIVHQPDLLKGRNICSTMKLNFSSSGTSCVTL